MIFTAKQLINLAHRPKPWDDDPVFVFTSDIDWASEEVLDFYRQLLPICELKLTAFVTHHSPLLDEMQRDGEIFRGIHPNFLPNSSHGNSFKEVIEACREFAPEAIGTRSHRLFSVTDVAHLLRFEYNFHYMSNTIASLSTHLRPQVHESTLLEFPIFFEDGTFLFQNLGLSIQPFEQYFTAPGLKIISFHPMNMVFNTPEIAWMRKMKDSMSRDDFNRIDRDFILKNRHCDRGIANIVMDIIEIVKQKNYKIVSLDDLYYQTINE